MLEVDWKKESKEYEVKMKLKQEKYKKIDIYFFEYNERIIAYILAKPLSVKSWRSTLHIGEGPTKREAFNDGKDYIDGEIKENGYKYLR